MDETKSYGSVSAVSSPTTPTPSFAPFGVAPVSAKTVNFANWRVRKFSVRANGTVPVGPLGTHIKISVPMEDLLRDEYIVNARRMDFNGKTVPFLGDVPLLHKLGQGGMGAVYYGIHPGFAKEVAVKVLPFHLAKREPTAVERFYREARLSIGIVSNHLVSVMDVAEDCGIFYLVMEYVNGQTAGSLLKQGMLNGAIGLSEKSALEICIAACEGLAAAHERNVIHRDIKPDNILLPKIAKQTALNYMGAKLADLGLARNVGLNESMTGINACLGTPGFMAPEQIEDAHTAGKPADIFGMGATLYTLLSGTPPFYGENVMPVMRDTVCKAHLPIRAKRPDVTLATSTVIDISLAKDPAHRYGDAAALLRALRTCYAGIKNPQLISYSAINLPVVKTRQEIQHQAIEILPVPVFKPKRHYLSWSLAALVIISLVLFFSYRKSDPESKLVLDNPFPNAHALDQEATDNDQEVILKDQVKQREFLAANEKMNQQAEAKRAADTKQKSEALRKDYENSIVNVKSAIGAKDFKLADNILHSAIGDSASGSADNDKILNVLRAQVKIGLQNERVAAEADRLITDVKARIQAEPLDEFAHCALMPESARIELKDSIAHLENLQKLSDVELADLLKRMNRNAQVGANASGMIDLVLVSPGTFTMGYKEWPEGSGSEFEHEVHVTVPFYLSKNPITVGQFRRFVESTQYVTDAERGDSLGKGAYGIKQQKNEWCTELTWRNPGFTQTDEHPVVCLSNNDCQVYCEWLGKKLSRRIQLPSETEWEYAARGVMGNQWPWGNTWDGKRCNHSDLALKNSGTLLKPTPGGSFSPVNDGSTFTAPVGHFDNRSWCEANDMAGNVSQWCSDWFNTNAYLTSTDQSARTLKGEAIKFSNGEYSQPCKVIRGGSFLDQPDMQRSSARKKLPANWRAIDTGFRIVLMPDLDAAKVGGETK